MTKEIEEDEDMNFKVVLLGEAGVGKTSIIYQFVEQIFDEDLQSSTGSSYSSKILTFNNGKKIKLEIWDTAGQERYRALSKLFYSKASAAVLVYDITKKFTFDEIRNYWIFQLKESAPKDIIITIAANKADLIEGEEVNEDEARKFAKDNGALFFSTSAKNSLGINEMFIEIGKKFFGWDSKVELEESINTNNDEDNNNENIKKNNENNINNNINGNNNKKERKDTIKLNQGNNNDNKNDKKKKSCC